MKKENVKELADSLDRILLWYFDEHGDIPYKNISAQDLMFWLANKFLDEKKVNDGKM